MRTFSNFTLSGLDELENAISYMLANYNDQTETALKRVGNNFKKSVIEKTPNGTTKKSANKKLIKSFVVSGVQGDFKNKWVDFRSKAPHFHLIERGHRIYSRSSKKDTGRNTKPLNMVFKTYKEYEEKYPKELKDVLEALEKKAKKNSKKG